MRLSNTNNFSASFNVATPYQMVVIHSSKLIYRASFISGHSA